MNSKQYRKYSIESKHRVAELKAYALQYWEWKMKLDEEVSLSAVNLDGMPHGTQTGNPTEQKAIRSAELLDKIGKVEKCARLCSSNEQVQKVVLCAVTRENITFNYIKQKGLLYYERDAFYLAKRKFYWLLDREI